MNKSWLLKINPLIILIFCLVGFCKVCSAYEAPKIWNLSKENVFFVGREEKLQAMKAFFIKDERDILVLTGGPGFGKTQIAKKYAQQFNKDYTLIWWIDAQQDISNQFKKLAIALNHILPEREKIIPSTLSKEALVDRVKDILRMRDIRYLLIFDNAESYDQIEKYIPSTYHQSC